MESGTVKKQLVHILPLKRQWARRKRSSSLNCEEISVAANNLRKVDHNPFTFPPPPFKPSRPSSDTTNLSESDDSLSDTSVCQYVSSPLTCMHARWRCQGYQSEGSPVPLHAVPHLLPPIGVFWDIENCQVPKGRSAVAVAQIIRKRFFTGYREAEFLVVCDVKKESNQILEELNDAQVNLIHVASVCKNAADEKLRQSMRRFADIHGSPASIVLISGDINFAPDITDLRHRKKINVILLHMGNASENLILCASEHYSFSELVESLPLRGAMKQSSQPVEVLVYNLPPDKDRTSVKIRLRQLSSNCGGRVTSLKQTCATIRFSSLDVACRAQKRMDGEDVYGRKIQVSQPVRVVDKEGSPLKNHIGSTSGKRIQMNGGRESISEWIDSAVFASSSAYCVPENVNFHGTGINQHSCVGNWSVYASTTSAQEYYTGICTGFNPPAVDVSSSNLSFSALGGQKNAHCLLPRTSPTVMVNAPCGLFDKAPKELRKIRGIHKGLMPLETESSEIEVNQVTRSSTQNRIHSIGTYPTSSVPDSEHNITRDVSSPFVIASDIGGIKKRSSSKGCSVGPSRTTTPAMQHYDDASDSEHVFHPINSSDVSQLNGSNSNEPVELHVSNLDPTFGAREMKKILLNAFKEHVMVLSLLVLVQQDGSLIALVRLSSQQDAQYAIYKLQRHKIGHKRIRISHVTVSRPSPQLIRSQVISLLQEVPNHKLPLFKFCELYESRYLCSISISDIYKVKECEVTDGPRGRIVALVVDSRNSPSPQLQVLQEMEVLETPFCPLHGHELKPNRGWAEQEVLSLPSVTISLKLLSERIHALLQTHNDSIHLNSLPQCYQAQFETLEENKDGVALEHLVSCIPGIEIVCSPGNIKYIRLAKSGPGSNCSSKTDEDVNKISSLAGKLSTFSRELVDLLKTSPRCQISFDKFIPAYHHHFGRQCRVADYGFTKLIELLESLPQTVQVLGEGNRRMVTLSHRVQQRRFMGDLHRVLRGQVNKEVLLSELPEAFERVFNKPFIVTSYGVCDVMDLLTDLPDASVVITSLSDTNDLLFATPKREQTPEEIEKTRQFAEEVVELLRHVPNCTMRFNKFIPAHHIHFGWQCRVADYGFTKLVELFEAVPDVVKIENVDGERWISLTREEHLKVLADQIATLLQSTPECSLTVSALKNNYRLQFGYSLRPETFDCTSVEELLALLPDTFKVTEYDGKVIVSLGSNYVLQQFIQDIQRLVLEAGGSLLLSSVELKFLRRYGRRCRPAQFGFSSLGALLQSLRGAVRLRGRGTRRTVMIADVTGDPVNVSADHAASATETSNNLSVGYMYSTSKIIADLRGDSSSNNENDSGHDDASSSSAVDVDTSLSSGSKVQVSERSSMSEIISDASTCINGGDLLKGANPSTPGKGNSCDSHPDVSPVWCVDSPPSYASYKGPWSHQTIPELKVTDSPAVMLSPSSNLLPAFSTQKTSSNLVMCHLPPLYSYPPFLPGHVPSPEPSTLPLPQLSLAPSLPAFQEVQVSTANDGSNTSTPNKTKVKRRLAAQFQTPLDLP